MLGVIALGAFAEAFAELRQCKEVRPALPKRVEEPATPSFQTVRQHELNQALSKPFTFRSREAADM